MVAVMVGRRLTSDFWPNATSHFTIRQQQKILKVSQRCRISVKMTHPLNWQRVWAAGMCHNSSILVRFWFSSVTMEVGDPIPKIDYDFQRCFRWNSLYHSLSMHDRLISIPLGSFDEKIGYTHWTTALTVAWLSLIGGSQRIPSLWQRSCMALSENGDHSYKQAWASGISHELCFAWHWLSWLILNGSQNIAYPSDRLRRDRHVRFCMIMILWCNCAKWRFRTLTSNQPQNADLCPKHAWSLRMIISLYNYTGKSSRLCTRVCSYYECNDVTISPQIIGVSRGKGHWPIAQSLKTDCPVMSSTSESPIAGKILATPLPQTIIWVRFACYWQSSVKCWHR